MIEKSLDSKIIEAILDDPEIIKLLIEGHTDAGDEVTDPDSPGFSPEIMAASKKAQAIARQIHPSIGLIEFYDLFLIVRKQVETGGQQSRG